MKATLWNYLAAVVCAVALQGCASTASIDSKSRTFQRVGVLSVAGTYLTQTNVGVTAFGNEYAELDVSIWKLDDTFSQIVADTLRQQTPLKVVVISSASDILKSHFRPSSLSHVALDLDSRWGQAEEIFQRIAAENDVEALVLLVPRTSGDYFKQTNQIIRGLGIYTRSFGDRTNIAALHLISRLVVVSGQTGKVLGHVPVSRVQPTMPGGPHQRGQPSVGIPSALARTPITSMTDGERNKVRELAAGVPLRSALEATVPELFPSK